MSIKISHQFDAGSIDVQRADTPGDIQLKIRNDTNSEFLQWFYFRLQGAAGQACEMRFLNAAQAAYPQGWEDYQAVASYDREHWFRVPTRYEGGVLRISHTPEHDSIYYAYFEPYSWDRHLSLLATVQAAPQGRVEDLCATLDGRDLNLAVIGNPGAAKKTVWIIARQHPGETMAEWFVEGLIEALLDRANPVGRKLLQQAVFYIVPNMNPDGSVRGNLRVNAAGANLNREWVAPTLERSPEVFAVKRRIEETGVDLFLDIHGDEALPYVFIAGSEMLDGFSAEQMSDQQTFLDDLRRASPDFQTEFGYEAAKYREEMLQLASKYIGHTYKCVSLTLEMPFKDNAILPDPEVGWNGARSKRLGEAMLQAILGAVR
ncbi:M14 family metallopeptidase [Noviherbaspirillum galbum]|uniref:Carboxypeptidase family protein n=1 Tax=Noviherbaspirillum galbum TaxID=2709383 RepID=A0A6B3SUD5_9BURK|nr:M14-type cytosolic carboxypeptidase [Noviherbaspirillum galbum]NEX62486.1 carboxypeptidase family protein [Noviherbaspirillum galbum]